MCQVQYLVGRAGQTVLTARCGEAGALRAGGGGGPAVLGGPGGEGELFPLTPPAVTTAVTATTAINAGTAAVPGLSAVLHLHGRGGGGGGQQAGGGWGVPGGEVDVGTG